MAIKIDEIDKRILYELEKNARIPDVKLAKAIGKSKDSVRYRIKKLEKEGIIQGYRTWIDITKLGYRTSTIYLTLLNLPTRKEQLLNEIKKDKRVYWTGVAEGVWNVGVSYFIKSNNELFEIKNSLFSKYNDLIIECDITSLVSVSVHEKNFLVRGESSLITFTEGFEEKNPDKISKNILKELYNNSRANIAFLADKCNTTIDIVKNRMKKLEKGGIIIRYTIALDYQKLGYEFYKSFIYLKSYKKEDIEKILKYAEKSEVIINIVKQVASWDFEFVLFARSFQEYNMEIDKLTERFSKTIRKVETATMSQDIIFPCAKLIFE